MQIAKPVSDQESTESEDHKYVVVRLRDHLFGLPVALVSEMLPLSRVVPVPEVASYVRGVMNLRGKVLAAVDLRRRLGLPSLEEEIVEVEAMLTQREEDHRAWLVELEASVREKRPFLLSTDPHACAFGRWYDSYEPQNLVLASHLKRFDEPHRRIHGIACKVRDLVDASDVEGALRRIDETRGRELASMIQLFREAKRLIRSTHREIAVVVCAGGGELALTVDQVEAVDVLTPYDSHNLEAFHVLDTKGKRCLEGIATYGKDEAFVALLSIETVCEISEQVRSVA